MLGSIVLLMISYGILSDVPEGIFLQSTTRSPKLFHLIHAFLTKY